MTGATTLLIIDIGAHLVGVLNTAHLKLKSSFPTLSAGVVTETLHFTYDATNDTSAVYGDVVCVIITCYTDFYLIPNSKQIQVQ